MASYKVCQSYSFFGHTYNVPSRLLVQTFRSQTINRGRHAELFGSQLIIRFKNNHLGLCFKSFFALDSNCLASPYPQFTMQLTLLASLAVLCTSAFAAPVESRDSSEVEVLAYVENVLNDADITVAKCEGLVDVIVGFPDVEDDLNDLDVNVLTKRQILSNVIADVEDELETIEVKFLGD
ncbi:uncharacterized protein HD556DRAFT_1471837 [Suillus plorans]|uniref:Uncharacterized protein n=1 Tax=Suillus plorans TaxID=116603 RepID=A0A9P7AVJ6_9AGAM|nr:uncharacterized protein HD556DRAFT_1471837 [Suillus plorans]KAG1795643.1 hypothetical protein HD556DRAFT_1471837 [Suillus plorans]